MNWQERQKKFRALEREDKTLKREGKELLDSPNPNLKRVRVINDRLEEIGEELKLRDVVLDRPDYTQGEAKIGDGLSRILVHSRYDELGDFDLFVEYAVKMRSHRSLGTPPPEERLHRAYLKRAAELLHAEDELPYRTRTGEVKTHTVPAVDPRLFTPWDGTDSFPVGREMKSYADPIKAESVRRLYEFGIKANELIHSTQSGYGDEYVPTLMTAALWRQVRLDGMVLPQIPQFDMISNPQTVAKEGDGPTFYKVAETTSDDSFVWAAIPIADSKISTAKATFNAGKFGAISFWSAEMEEDSVVPFGPYLRDKYGAEVAYELDYLLLSGDETTGATTNISYNGATPGGTESFLTVDGMRHEPLDTTTADSRDGGTLTLDDVTATRKLMGTAGKYGANPSDLVIFCDSATGLTFQSLDEVVTVDKFGPNATVLTGQLGAISGIPIITPEKYGLTYTNGFIHSTGTNNTKGSFIVVNRDMVRVGWKRRPRVYVGQVPYADAWYILVLSRFDIGFFGAGGVACSYNITV